MDRCLPIYVPRVDYKIVLVAFSIASHGSRLQQQDCLLAKAFV